MPVRFGDCDPAGIIYFPRFFHFFHEAMETWFGEALGLPYAELIHGRLLGFPAVHTEADFRVPCRMGDVIHVELRVVELGTSSIRFGYRVFGRGDPEGSPPRLTGATVCVVLNMDPKSPRHRRSRPLPDGLRAKIEAFGIAGA